jgi:hypothetical protein
VVQGGQFDAFGLHHLAEVDEVVEIAPALELRAAMAHAHVVKDTPVALSGKELLVRDDHRMVGCKLDAWVVAQAANLVARFGVLLLCAALVHSEDSRSNRNVMLITLDGVRVHEMFGGADIEVLRSRVANGCG